MKDPVIGPDGVTYERAAIQHWMAHNKESPVTHKPLPNIKLVPNIGAKSAIVALLLN